MRWRRWLASEINPRDAKDVLGKAIVAQYWGSEKADQAAAEFRRRSEGLDPLTIPEVAMNADQLDATGEILLARLLVLLGFESSTSNARRTIEQGGVKIGPDRTVIKEPKALLTVSNGLIVRVGKVKIARIVLQGQG